MKADESVVVLYDLVGTFAEDKDKAREIRLNRIIPALKEGKPAILDFQGVDSTTQSFIHALISDVIRKEGIDVLDRLLFKNCNEIVKAVIEIVVDYMQEPPTIIHDRINGKNEPASSEKKA